MARAGLGQSNAGLGSAVLAAGAGRGYYGSFFGAAAGWTRLGPSQGEDGTPGEGSGGTDRQPQQLQRGAGVGALRRRMRGNAQAVFPG